MADYKGLASEIDATFEHLKTRRTYRGKIGKLQSDNSITLQSGLSDKNLVWVTLNDQTREVIAALCLRVKKQINLPVVVGYNDYKRLEVLGIDTAPALDAFGEATPTFNAPDRVGEFVDEVVAPKNLPPRVYPSQAGGLYVTVAPFDWDGGWWPGGDLLLTVPATASKKAWCIVCLKTSDNTLAQITGTEYSLAYTLTHTELAAVTITSAYIPLWGFVLANSSTVVLGVQNEPLTYRMGRKNGDGVLTVKEIDGAPNVSPVTTIRVSNGSLTDDGSGQVTVTTTGGGGIQLFKQDLTQANAGVNTLFTPTANATILEVAIEVTVAAAGGAPTVKVGISGTDNKYMTTAENDLGQTGIYRVFPYFDEDGTPDAIILTIAADSQTFSFTCYVRHGVSS